MIWPSARQALFQSREKRMSSVFSMRVCGVAGALLAALVLAGCGQDGGKPKDGEQAKPAVEAPKTNAEAPKTAAPAVPVPAAPAAVPPPPAVPKAPAPKPKATAAAPAPAKKWVLLGRVQADFRKGRDRIVVGKGAGVFRELRVTVRDAPMELHEMVVTFGNDRKFRPSVKFFFNEKTTSGRIDLPGEKRVIKHVDFVFRSPDRKEGLATLVLHGR
jgi:hypothetical protein